MSAWSAFARQDDALDEIARSQVRALGLLQVGIAENLEAQKIGFNRIEIGLRRIEQRLEVRRLTSAIGLATLVITSASHQLLIENKTMWINNLQIKPKLHLLHQCAFT
ncbi:hypothetical protein [Tritonibacter mobilis]|uniref:hypothetical protein n=1 Tax=Tritonibacter mobilis TaxID=379347 RepID=UPI0001B8B374|nr:hypothetical protein SCH4B_3685 [Ruegeria sp. TrichCH4B]